LTDTHYTGNLQLKAISKANTVCATTIWTGLRPNWVWCCCPERGLLFSRHSRVTKYCNVFKQIEFSGEFEYPINDGNFCW